tara:strand:- start:737 stop:940 length:204 start_codon:yes stop_codon:yes gene_type:complete
LDPSPLQEPGDYYSFEDESLFRRSLESILMEISYKVDSIDHGRTRASRESVSRSILHSIPVGQTEIG